MKISEIKKQLRRVGSAIQTQEDRFITIERRMELLETILAAKQKKRVALSRFGRSHAQNTSS